MVQNGANGSFFPSLFSLIFCLVFGPFGAPFWDPIVMDMGVTRGTFMGLFFRPGAQGASRGLPDPILADFWTNFGSFFDLRPHF